VLAGGDNHLRIVISKELPETKCVLVCNTTDAKNEPESPIQFYGGEHRRIVKPSAISIKYLVDLPVSKFAEAIKLRLIVIREDLPVEIVELIVAGLLACKDVPEKFKKYLR
jgi:hypothetical protein